jgi:hypothetical protein
MEPPTPPLTQDPIDRFAIRIEAMRQDSAVRGPMRLVQKLMLDFFMAMLKLLTGLAEQRRNGTLPVVAPVPEPEEPRAWPDDLRPRESGWAERRDLYDPWGDSRVHGQVEPPEMVAPICEVPCEMPPCEIPRVEQPPRPYYADGGAGMLCTAEAGFLRLFLKKRVLAGLDFCVHFVTI